MPMNNVIDSVIENVIENVTEISIDNHAYCFDCHNRMALRAMGVDDSYTYAKNMSVIEPGGKAHAFKIEHIVLGDIVSWEANEQGEDYQFRMISQVGENGAAVAQRLYRKVVEGVCTKTLEEHKSAWGTFRSLKAKGNITFIEDEDRNYAIGFEIDGVKYTPEEFAGLVSGYAGFRMKYQVVDGFDDILGENEYLVPIKITKEGLIEELEVALTATTDRRGFLSNQSVPAFDELFSKVLKKLQVLVDALEREKAQECGEAIIERLLEVEYDDDSFPEEQIRMIRKIVGP